ncbi:MAG: hypothetical protein ACU0FH_16770 [Heliomarina sp.]|uniref:hypothetical protein n=1 Tax=Heliomarina sp. TaxID=2917556 RepID=UPI0040586E78
MSDPADLRAWFDAFFADVMNGVFSLIAALCLVYLISVARNLADPGKHSPLHVKGVAVAVAVFAVSLLVVFLRGGTDQGEENELGAEPAASPAATEEAASERSGTSNKQHGEDNKLPDASIDFDDTPVPVKYSISGVLSEYWRVSGDMDIDNNCRLTGIVSFDPPPFAGYPNNDTITGRVAGSDFSFTRQLTGPPGGADVLNAQISSDRMRVEGLWRGNDFKGTIRPALPPCP